MAVCRPCARCDKCDDREDGGDGDPRATHEISGVEVAFRLAAATGFGEINPAFISWSH
jgi:hypothetical protein